MLKSIPNPSKTLANFRISHKIFIAFAAVLCCTAALGWIAVERLRAVNAAAAEIRDHWLPTTRGLGEVAYQIQRFRSIEGAYLIAVGGARDEEAKTLDKIRERLDRDLAAQRALTHSQDEDEALADLAKALGDYYRLDQKLVSLARNGGESAAGDLFRGEMRGSIHVVQDRLSQQIAENVRGGDQAAERGAAIGASAERWIEVLIAAAVALCLAIGWSLNRGINRPIFGMTAAMSRLAGGDMSVEVPGAGLANEIGEMARSVMVFRDNGRERRRLEKETTLQREATENERQRASAERARTAAEQLDAVARIGEALKSLADGDLMVRLNEDFPERYARIKEDFNHAIGKLRAMLLAVVASTETIRVGAQELSVAAETLSGRTEQQAASLEETAAALEEITTTVKKSADGAAEAREIVTAADAEARMGSTVAARAIEAMVEITQSANQIGAIIGVIDEIAFQTNLLALNAGVEAARAGDAGRGFAVVASEVRALAQRCTEAAREIKGLISASSSQVEQGVKLVNDTGQLLERIVTQVARINEIVGDIAAGVNQQASALGEVNIAVNQMDQVTQKNVEMAEELSSATCSLSMETTELNSLIDMFQVGRSGGRSSISSPQGTRDFAPPSRIAGADSNARALRRA